MLRLTRWADRGPVMVHPDAIALADPDQQGFTDLTLRVHAHNGALTIRVEETPEQIVGLIAFLRQTIANGVAFVYCDDGDYTPVTFNDLRSG